MPIRWRKSIKIAPGVKVNLSPKGVRSTSIGGKRLRINLGKNGTSVGGSIGGGLSWSHRLSRRVTGGRGCGCCGPAAATLLLALVAGVVALLKRTTA